MNIHFKEPVAFLPTTESKKYVTNILGMRVKEKIYLAMMLIWHCQLCRLLCERTYLMHSTLLTDAANLLIFVFRLFVSNLWCQFFNHRIHFSYIFSKRNERKKRPISGCKPSLRYFIATTAVAMNEEDERKNSGPI